MTRTTYTFLLYLSLPLWFAWLWWRGRRNPAYRRRWAERLAMYRARLPVPDAATLVFHAVSVGEVHAARPVIEQCLREQPQLRLVVTCTTATGSERISQLFGDRVLHAYMPYDLPGAVRRFLDQFQPRLMVLLETELWPNLLHQCRQRGIRVVLANARLSARSYEGYRKHAALSRSLLRNLDAVVAQAQADGERFVALGLPMERLQINGSLKFDVAIDEARVARARQLRSTWDGRPAWIAASTREGEDAKVLQAQQRVLADCPSALLVLVPRHPERFAEAAARAAASGLRTRRFSEHGEVTADTQVLVGDTMGDLYFYYALCDLAFVGGSLVDTGCQNLIEPAALGLPVLSGPSLYNFKAVSELLLESGGLQVVADERELAAAVVALLGDANRRQHMGTQARVVVARNQGASERLYALLCQQLVASNLAQ